MKVISLLVDCLVVSLDKNILIKNSDGEIVKLAPGMEVHKGDLLLLPDNSNIVLGSKNQNVNISNVDGFLQHISTDPATNNTAFYQQFSFGNEFHHYDSSDNKHIVAHLDVEVSALQKKILDDQDPTKELKAPNAGIHTLDSSSIGGFGEILYDNDKMLAVAGFDTAYIPSDHKEHKDNVYPQVHHQLVADITIDTIAHDDVVDAAESHQKQTITGTVGGDVKVGDTVLVTLDGQSLGTTQVVQGAHGLVWSLDGVDGNTLLTAPLD
ncbi:Ig-like domain-containing protein, partial [Photobacterium angustum]